MRLSLIAMVLMFMRRMAGAWLASGYDRVGEPGGNDTRGSTEPGERGGTGFSNTLDPVAYSFIYKLGSDGYLELEFQYRELHEGHGCTCTAGEHGESGRGRVPL